MGTLAQENLAQDTTVCCNIGRKCLSMSLIQNTNEFQTRFQTQMATPPAQANLAQDLRTLALVTSSLKTQMATPLAQAMTLAQANLAQDTTVAQGLRTLALVTSSLKTQMATPPVQA